MLGVTIVKRKKKHRTLIKEDASIYYDTIRASQHKLHIRLSLFIANILLLTFLYAI